MRLPCLAAGLYPPALVPFFNNTALKPKVPYPPVKDQSPSEKLDFVLAVRAIIKARRVSARSPRSARSRKS